MKTIFHSSPSRTEVELNVLTMVTGEDELYGLGPVSDLSKKLVIQGVSIDGDSQGFLR